MSPTFSDNQKIEQALLELLEIRGSAKSLCPSEVARRVDSDAWRSLMPAVRTMAWQLEEQGKVVVTQKGKRVSRDARGPIRIGQPVTPPGNR